MGGGMRTIVEKYIHELPFSTIGRLSQIPNLALTRPWQAGDTMVRGKIDVES